MIDEQDRLPDWAYTEDELDEMAEELIDNTDLQLKGHLAFYKLYKDNTDTGVVMLLAVESVSDGLHAINRLWGQYNMYCEIEHWSEEEDAAVMYRLLALSTVLNKFKYTGKIKAPGSNHLYKYSEWMKNLL